MKLKRSIAALLLAVLLTSAVSCAPHTGIPDDSTQTNETTAENESTDNIAEKELTLYDGADNIFRIVTATSPTDSERSFAEELAAKARSVFKVKPETNSVRLRKNPRISSTPSAMLARPRSSLRPGRAGLGLSVAPSELMNRMIAAESLATQVTEAC